MGVDFYTCDTCDESFCSDSILFMELEYGEFKTCNWCCKQYFIRAFSADTKYEIVQDHEKKHGFTLFASDKTDRPADHIYCKKDVVFTTTSLADLIEFAVDKTNLVFGCIPTDVVDTEEEWCVEKTIEAVCDNVFDCIAYEEGQAGRDLSDDYSMDWIPNVRWKMLMRTRLDEQIQDLQIKRRKLEE